MNEIKICTAGDSSLLIEFGQEISPEINAQITALVRMIRAQHIEGVTDMIPAFASLLINYDPRVVSYAGLRARMEKLLKLEISGELRNQGSLRFRCATVESTARIFRILRITRDWTPEEVIKIHSSEDYLIYMLGFLPGFSYLGGLDERIHTPRLANPRIRIPAGSVGIGGSQTGIYPLDSPGGWQLLGMTPVKTYDPGREVPILFEAGDYIRFVPVSEEEYQEIKKQVDEGTYQCTIHQKGV